MVSAMDHKRALDNDKGLNTGGMGTVAPNPYYTADVAKTCMDTIFMPTIKAMSNEGRTFKGCLFFGLMITPNGPKVIEYNCRFGDPETQVVLPLLESDLFDIMQACANGTLDKTEVKFSDGAACCVIMASNGYPQKYESGFPITVDSTIDATLYYAGAKIKDDVVVSAGGRVVGVTATADSLPQAIKNAYKATEKVHFENAYKRTDIGKRALAAITTEE
jgi:phosphoribosylamine--glycine ligase